MTYWHQCGKMISWRAVPAERPLRSHHKKLCVWREGDLSGSGNLRMFKMLEPGTSMEVGAALERGAVSIPGCQGRAPQPSRPQMIPPQALDAGHRAAGLHFLPAGLSCLCMIIPCFALICFFGL